MKSFLRDSFSNEIGFGNVRSLTLLGEDRLSDVEVVHSSVDDEPHAAKKEENEGAEVSRRVEARPSTPPTIAGTHTW